MSTLVDGKAAAMQAVEVIVEDDKIYTSTPYSNDFVTEARKLGRWNAHSRQWIFDIRDESRVRKLITDVYGVDTDQEEEADENLVTIRIPAEKFWGDRELKLAGQVIAKRWSRDSSVRLIQGAAIIEGRFPSSGGSRNNPKLGHNDAIIEWRDIPIGVAMRAIEDAGKYIEITFASNVEQARHKLEVEKERLEQKLSDIVTTIGKLANCG